MSENLLVPIVRYLVEDLTRKEFEAALKAGHVEFLAKAFDLKTADLVDAVLRSRAERQWVLGAQESMAQGSPLRRAISG